MSADKQIDEDLYSRQLYVLGKEAMQKMSISDVLIVGLTGLGIEIAKNVILSGVNSVTLYDNDYIQAQELGTNYYAKEEDVGKERTIVAPKLSELNPYVTVSTTANPNYSDYTVVVIAKEMSIEQLITINEECRKEGTKFILATSIGLTGSVFCDFGNEFTVCDTDGEQLHSGVVTGADDKGYVCAEPHNLQNGANINVNGCQIEIQFVDTEHFKTNFNIPDNTQWEEVKKQETINFKSLQESIFEPDFLMTNLLDFERPNKLHALWLNHLKGADLSALPLSTEYIIGIGKELTPINSIIGGLAAQEVMKACSGKFMPIRQWFYFDDFECLPGSRTESKYSGTRYEWQDEILGLNNKLKDMNYFVVGAGAIGCELLKNFAMMGLGNMIVTDMDTIERSNLNRQFLFRDHNIGQPKSVAAAEAIKQMNPDVNITSHENRVGPENEKVYNKAFYDSLDGVANALDNVQARLYMDQQCVKHKLSLLESGTLGTKGNVQVVVPDLTESYGSSSDPAEQSIPVCTIKNFPYKIDHTIQWARDVFAGLFEQAPRHAVQYLNDPLSVNDMPDGDVYFMAENVHQVLDYVPNTFKECLQLAFNLWHKYYRDNILELLNKFPHDHKTNEGANFWSGTKKCPQALSFDGNDKHHVNFVLATANMYASIYKINGSRDVDLTLDILPSLQIPGVQIDNNKHISANDEEEKEHVKNTTYEDIDSVKSNLPKVNEATIVPASFEKDDDTNWHIDFVTAASNMRALNYSIEPADKHKTKGIAGKIIPAIATTTAIVAGLVSLEFYKLAQGFKDIAKYKNYFLNLALPFMTFSEPMPTPKTEFNGKTYTMWDEFTVDGDRTVNELLDYFEDEHGIPIEFISWGTAPIYTGLIMTKKMMARQTMNVRDIVLSLDPTFSSDQVWLTISPETEDDDEVIDLPQVRMVF